MKHCCYCHPQSVGPLCPSVENYGLAVGVRHQGHVHFFSWLFVEWTCCIEAILLVNGRIMIFFLACGLFAWSLHVQADKTGLIMWSAWFFGFISVWSYLWACVYTAFCLGYWVMVLEVFECCSGKCLLVMYTEVCVTSERLCRIPVPDSIIHFLYWSTVLHLVTASPDC